MTDNKEQIKPVLEPNVEDYVPSPPVSTLTFRINCPACKYFCVHPYLQLDENDRNDDHIESHAIERESIVIGLTCEGCGITSRMAIGNNHGTGYLAIWNPVDVAISKAVSVIEDNRKERWADLLHQFVSEVSQQSVSLSGMEIRHLIEGVTSTLKLATDSAFTRP